MPCNCFGYMGAVNPSSCDGNGGYDPDGNLLNSDGSLYTSPCPTGVIAHISASCDGNGGTDADGNLRNSDGSLYTGPCPTHTTPAGSISLGPLGSIQPAPLILIAAIFLLWRHR